MSDYDIRLLRSTAPMGRMDRSRIADEIERIENECNSLRLLKDAAEEAEEKARQENARLKADLADVKLELQEAANDLAEEVLNATTKPPRLEAENARLREALEQIRDETSKHGGAGRALKIIREALNATTKPACDLCGGTGWIEAQEDCPKCTTKEGGDADEPRGRSGGEDTTEPPLAAASQLEGWRDIANYMRESALHIVAHCEWLDDQWKAAEYRLGYKKALSAGAAEAVCDDGGNPGHSTPEMQPAASTEGACLPALIIPAALWCPHCGASHVDETRGGERWDRRGHTTHRCQACGGDFDVYVKGTTPETSDE